MEEVIIEQLTTKDWRVLKDLWLHALKEDEIPFGSSYAEESVKSDEEWKQKFEAGPKYAARVSGTYVGLVGVRYEKQMKMSHTADIIGFYVLKEWQGKGIGRKLMEHVIAEMYANPKIIRLRLGVDVERINAIKLYEDLGFVKTGTAYKAVKVADHEYHDHAQMLLIFEDKV